MYKVLGADGKEYGPVSLEQLRQWRQQGRVSAQTRVRPAAAADWSPAQEVPELAALFVPATPPPLPPPLPAGKSSQQPKGLPQQGMAVASLILGILSFALCLSVVAGIPAIVCGSVARRRIRQSPRQWAGAGLALAGLTLGYLNLVVSLALGAAMLPVAAKAKARASSIACANHLKQVGLAFNVWAMEHGDDYPFNVSTNRGGSRELCAPGEDGFDGNAASHLRVLSNELGSPGILLCPTDAKKAAAPDFSRLQLTQISYRIRTGTNVNGMNPQEILAVCPIHGHSLHCDGSVQTAGP
jgi:hypothetical protein